MKWITGCLNIVFMTVCVLPLDNVAGQEQLAAESTDHSVEAVLSFRKESRKSVSEAQKITTPNGIDAQELVPLNGVRHALSIRGKNKQNPVILYLHGGPGFPMMPFAYKYLRDWEQDFVVVQWDQRGAGKTHCANPDYDPSTATFEDFLTDAEAVVDYLRNRLNKEKIVVVGHSWGSLLGMHLIKKRPEWVSAYVGTGQVVNSWDQEGAGYAFALREAHARQDKEAIAALEALKPYPDESGYLNKLPIQRKYVMKYGGGLRNGVDYMAYFHSAFFESPAYSLKDWSCWLDALNGHYHTKLLLRQFAKDSDIGNLAVLGYEFDMPIFFFLGRYDEQVSTRVAKEYFMQIDAPYRRLITFDHSGHSPPTEEPQVFLRALKEYVLPNIAD